MIKRYQAQLSLKGDTDEDVGVGTLMRYIKIFNQRNPQINNTKIELDVDISVVHEGEFLLELPDLYELISEQVPDEFEFRELIIHTLNSYEVYYDKGEEGFFAEGRLHPPTIEHLSIDVD